MRFTKAQLSDLQNEIRELTGSNAIEVIASETKVSFGADDMVESLTLTLKLNGKKETKTILPYDKWHKDLFIGYTNDGIGRELRYLFLECVVCEGDVEFLGYVFNYNHFESEPITDSEVDWNDRVESHDYCNEHRHLTHFYHMDGLLEYDCEAMNWDMFWDEVCLLYNGHKNDIVQKADELGLVVDNYKLKHWHIGYKPKYTYGIHETIYCFKKQDADFTAKESEMVEFLKGVARDIYNEAIAYGMGLDREASA